MEILKVQNPNELAIRALDWIANRVLEIQKPENKKPLLLLPAGNTPIPLYQLMEQTKPAFMDQCRLTQVDEIITGNKKNLFKSFFANELPSYAAQFESLHEARIEPQNCISVLGLGLNGHLAFHEPHIPSPFFLGCTLLDVTTQDSLQISDNPWAITYGADFFAQTFACLLLVTGEKKQSIFNKFLNPKDGPTLPCHRIHPHPKLTIFTDFEAHI